MAHREGIREYLKDVKLKGVVIDWGAGSKPIINYLENLGCEFYSVDVNPLTNPTLVKDIEKPTFLAKADMAFCLEVIEHCWDVKKVIENIYLNLKEGGVLYLSQPFMFEVHKADDRIRFTHHGLKQLIKEAGFRVFEIKPTVGEIEAAEGYFVKAMK